jgi:hypothetical protein
MIDCVRISELLPWYVTGKLDPTETAEVSAHIQSCSSCRDELAETVWLRHGVGTDTEETRGVKSRTWRHIAVEAGIYDSARIDVGSLMLGFRLGFRVARSGPPIRASLRVMGHNVRIVGRKKGESCKPEKKD